MRSIRQLLPGLSVTAGTLLLGFSSTAAQPSGAIPQAIRDIRAVANPAKSAPGQEFTVVVDLMVEEGMHIQAAKPLQEFLIGTRLEAEPVEGIDWKQARYPAPHERVDPVFGTLAEYSGNVRIELPGVVQTDAKPGPRPIKLSLRYQACTDQGACYPPKTVPIEAILTIIAPSTGGARISPASAAAVGGAGPGAAASAPAPTDSLPGALGSGALPTDAGAGSAAAPGGARPAAKAVETPIGVRLPWEPFSGARLAELTVAGRTVLIDFTADWCPNCKLNELIALNARQTAELVERNGVVPLLADFTREDPQIRDWLGKFRSVSVPLTVIVPGARPTEPILLRDTYRQATLLDALRRAGPSVEAGEVPAGERVALTLETPLTISEAGGSTWWYLLAGLVGGFILNFMPCVLPVISIKVLSLLGQAGESRRRVFGLGLSFAAGMIALFLALGLLVTVAGQTWGALFQSAAFLVVMLGIIVAMACSLFGAFTLSVPGAVGEADAAIESEGYIGSFGKGVLAVLLGTPCSGPFLGSALAWAAAKSAGGQPAVGMLVFLAMGVGMAFPFVVLAARPGWMRYLPRPGAWMETFKEAMGFLLLLTAVYIVYLLQDRVLAAILYSLGIAFAAWLYGKLVRPGRSPGANWVGRGTVAALGALLLWMVL